MTTYKLTYNLRVDLPSAVESALEGNDEYTDWDFVVDPDAKETKSLAYDILDTILDDEGIRGMAVEGAIEGCPLIFEDLCKEIADYAKVMQAKTAVDKEKVNTLVETLRGIFSEEAFNRFYGAFKEYKDVSKTEALANALADATQYLY